MKRDAAVEAVFKPVRPPTTFEETVERLGTRDPPRAARPGQPSCRPSASSPASCGISRSTLRQALTTLVQSGHLVSLRGRSGGTFVAERPPLAERGRGAARRATPGRSSTTGSRSRPARRCSPPSAPSAGDSTRSTSWSSGWPRPADFEEYRRADIRFHIGVAEAAHSPRLVTEMTEVQGQMSDLIALIAHPEEVLTRSNAQHRELVAAAAPSATRPARSRLMREHIEGTEHILAGLLPSARPPI